jgi:hypothetical protein
MVALANSQWAKKSAASTPPHGLPLRRWLSTHRALSLHLVALSARTAVERTEKDPVAAPPPVLSPAGGIPPPVLHHSDRDRSPSDTPHLASPPSPHPQAANPSSEVALDHSAESNHLHVFTSLFASQLLSLGPAERLFFTMLDDDLVTVNAFYLKQEEFFLSKWEVLSDQLTALLSQPHSDVQSPNDLLPVHAKHVLERALKELYRGLSLLRNYRILNYTAFVKITKKHDKVTSDGHMTCDAQLCTSHASFLLY